MPAVPVPSAFDSRCNAAYEALMWALARPGLPRDLAEAGHGAIVDALIDRECAVFCDSSETAAHAARAGAAPASLAAADHVFLDHVTGPEVLRDLRCGSDLHPDDGATLGATATIGTGQALRLSGPGIDGGVDVRVGGLPEGFWQVRAQAMRYPAGFEIFLTDGARVIGVPRSTRVEVL